MVLLLVLTLIGKKKSPPEILTQLSNDFQFVDFGLFKKGHKCNFDIKYKKTELTSIMEDLHDAFEKLNVELVKKVLKFLSTESLIH